MKRLLTLIGIIYCFSATIAFSQISVGLNGGLNLTTLANEKNIEDRWESGIGYRIGGFSEMSFGKFGVHFETDYSYVQIKGLFDDKIDLHYLSVPLTIFYEPIKRLKIFVGPEINVLLNQSGPKYKLSMGEEDFEKIDYGIHTEIEFSASERLSVWIRNYFGLQFNGELTQGNTRLNRLNILGVGVNYYLISHNN